MSPSLAGKSALITGAASGLGKAIAEKFLKAGAKVFIVDINEDRLKSASGELSAHGQVYVIKADITQEDSVKEVIDTAVAKLGALDILVNNAGIMDHFDAVGTLDKELWDRVIAVNLTAPMLMSKGAVGVEKFKSEGVILNVGSLAGAYGVRAGAAYTASKHGMVGLTKNTAAFYGSQGLRCNLIMPGMMQTNIADALANGMNQEGYQKMTLTAAMQPKTSELTDMAELALYLCSDSSIVLNGACIHADRGWAAY